MVSLVSTKWRKTEKKGADGVIYNCRGVVGAWLAGVISCPDNTQRRMFRLDEEKKDEKKTFSFSKRTVVFWTRISKVANQKHKTKAKYKKPSNWPF